MTPFLASRKCHFHEWLQYILNALVYNVIWINLVARWRRWNLVMLALADGLFEDYLFLIYYIQTFNWTFDLEKYKLSLQLSQKALNDYSLFLFIENFMKWIFVLFESPEYFFSCFEPWFEKKFFISNNITLCLNLNLSQSISKSRFQ